MKFNQRRFSYQNRSGADYVCYVKCVQFSLSMRRCARL